MTYNAVHLGKCNNASGRYIFGRSADGQTLVCAGSPSLWNNAGLTLFGQKSVGGACPPDITSMGMGRAAAQTVDGRPLLCGQQGWYVN